jgi:hypothetical protein
MKSGILGNATPTRRQRLDRPSAADVPDRDLAFAATSGRRRGAMLRRFGGTPLWCGKQRARTSDCKSSAGCRSAPAVFLAALRRPCRRALRWNPRPPQASGHTDRSQRPDDCLDSTRPRVDAGDAQYNRIQSRAWIDARRLANSLSGSREGQRRHAASVAPPSLANPCRTREPRRRQASAGTTLRRV